MSVLELTLYSRSGCHLCEEMKAVVEAVAVDYPLHLREVDIDTDPALRLRYDTEVPVLLINGRKAFKYRVSAPDLRVRLRRESTPLSKPR